MSHAVSVPPSGMLYNEDLVLSAEEQARLLEDRRFGQLDLANLIDEVRSVGASQKSKIRQHLRVVIAHLLKWRLQLGRRGASWQATIDHKRTAIHEVIEDSPSLRRCPIQVVDAAYAGARLQAAKETGIDFTLFPEMPPFTIEQILDDGYLLRKPDLEGQTP